jgi:hypothetical protein
MTNATTAADPRIAHMIARAEVRISQIERDIAGRRAEVGYWRDLLHACIAYQDYENGEPHFEHAPDELHAAMEVVGLHFYSADKSVMPA